MDTEESFDDDPMGIQALQVESDEDDLDLNLPPTTGNQYLRRVRQEANGCPKVVVADLDINAFKRKQTVHIRQWTSNTQPAPSGFAPSLKWQKMQVANFAEQRQNLARYKAKRKHLKVTKLPTVPHANDVEAWCRLCFGRLKPPPRQGAPGSQVQASVGEGVSGHNPAAAKDPADQLTTAGPVDTGPLDQDSLKLDEKFPTYEGILPLVSVMVAMDQPTVIKVLEYHLNWFEVTGFTERQGYWFYALLVCLDKPLIPDACSLLRDLARACSRLRASLDTVEDPRLVPLNLFICLIARYFDQSDLKDDVT